MQLIRFDSASAQPLEGGVNVRFVPIKTGERMTGMLLHLDRKGDTGKREVPGDVMLVVIAGAGRLRSGGHIADLQPGDVCILPGGIMHHIWTSDTELRAVLMAVGG
ncbi:MAG: hypothetical protein Kow00124_25980 [Anaerolineae bacterium]